MAEPNHWLVNAAGRMRPGTDMPADLAISNNISDAWRQVAALFQVTPMDLAEFVANAYGMKTGNIADFQPNETTLLPEKHCRDLNIVQLWVTADLACFACSDPRLSEITLSRLRFAVSRSVELVVLPPDEIDTCLTRFFSAKNLSSFDKTRAIDLLATNDNTPVVKLASSLLRMAIDRNASDIHIHPYLGGGAIRFRIDGRLRRIKTVTDEMLGAVARYFKAQAGLDSSPLTPQDGRLRLVYGRREIDVRLSVLPAYDGARIVCRLLDQSRNFSLQQCHFTTDAQDTLRRITNNTAGIVLLTGPTGSGKTSTLYALLAELNAADINIMTIEDPVEYVLPGISQVQVNEKQGMTFAESLRAILRQDPDIVLVGEIRDGETARIASQAALTGHLVLSTLHTNDALGSLPRMLDLGVEASILADALLGVVSQRLIRRLCSACRQPTKAPYFATDQEYHHLTGEYPTHHQVGCEVCDYTGFSGRLPIIESLEFSPALRQAIVTGERRLEVLTRIAASHRRSMAFSAKEWIAAGETTPAEVQHTLGMRFWNELAQEHSAPPEKVNVSPAQESTDDSGKVNHSKTQFTATPA